MNYKKSSRLAAVCASALWLNLSSLATNAASTASTDTLEQEQFAKTLNSSFKNWDYSGDGFLTEEDLEQALQDPQIKGEQAAALGAVKLYAKSKWSKNDLVDQFSLSDLQPVDAQSGQTTEAGKKLISLYGKCKKKIEKASPMLFASGVPHIEEIKQGKTGDCYFLSTAGGMAYHTPQRIIEMIQKNDDGSFSVTFPRHKPIDVAAPTDAEIACYSDAGDDGMWIHVLEKAYATYKNKKTRKYAIEPMDVVTHGGSGARMIMFMTGEACVRHPTASTSDDDLRKSLQNALEHNRVVNTGTSGHCLTILGYDPASDLITVWNPWGTSTNYSTVHKEMKNGVFQLSLAELKKYFVSILPEQDRAWTVADFQKFE